MRGPLRILWIPKSSGEFPTHPEMAYYGSNRLRAVNIHEHILSRGGVQSDVLGLTTAVNASIFPYDIVVIQKGLDRKVQAFLTKHLRRALVVFDACDPMSKKKMQILNLLADLVICSNHALQEDCVAKGLRVVSETVIDPHEADPRIVKEHSSSCRPVVTWYGLPENYPRFIKPMSAMLQGEDVDFRWCSGEDPELVNEPGFQKGVEWNMPLRVAWDRPHSWQKFIQQSDIGIVPVFDAVKAAHKVLNYMAYGIPVVCSPTDAHRRIIRHGYNGFFAENEEEWRTYVRRLKSPDVRREIGMQARESVLAAYSSERLGDEYFNTLMAYYNRKKGKHG